MGAKVLRLPFKSESSDDRSAFNRTRLTLARKRKGLSKLAFAKAVGVFRKSVEAWESGKTKPAEDAIAHIVRVTGFPRAFFMGDDLDEPSIDSGSFRSMKTMTAAQRDMATSQAALGLLLHGWLSKKFELPSAQIPDLGRESRVLPGEPASPLSPPTGCAFHPRCPIAIDTCSDSQLDVRLEGSPLNPQQVACIERKAS